MQIDLTKIRDGPGISRQEVTGTAVTSASGGPIMPANDPETRRLVAQIAANESWANTPDRAARTARARAALQAKFERQVDPEGTLPPVERAKRAESARRAHYQRMSLRSAQARRAIKSLNAQAGSGPSEWFTTQGLDRGQPLYEVQELVVLGVDRDCVDLVEDAVQHGFDPALGMLGEHAHEIDRVVGAAPVPRCAGQEPRRHLGTGLLGRDAVRGEDDEQHNDDFTDHPGIVAHPVSGLRQESLRLRAESEEQQ